MTTPIVLPGLRIEGGTPAERRAALANLDDAELAARLVEVADATRRIAGDLQTVATLINAPYPEVAASPFGVRACAMAASIGASLVHHELRALEPLDDADEAIDDAMHGVWDRGVLHVGKYRAFTQDEPFATFNPNHMAKWTAHELLHRVVGFVWRPAIPRWELYMSARLNELVPVVLWYGVDEALRGDASGFDRAAATRRPHVELADARWLAVDQSELHALALRSVAHVRHSLEHFAREFDAVGRELRQGRPVATPADGLDASSDAIAYVVGHADRLADRAYDRLFERALVAGDHVFADVPSYRDHVERVFDELLFGTLRLDPERAAARRDARACLDLFHRAASRGWGAFRRLVPLLSELRDATADIEHGVPFDEGHWRRRIVDALDPDAAGYAFASGLMPHTTASPRSIAQLDDGLVSCVPATRRWYARATLGAEDTLAHTLAVTQSLWRRAPLADRVIHMLSDIGASPALVELARLERRMLDARVDDHIERLCETSLGDAGFLVPSTAFSLMSFEHDVLALHADEVENLADAAGASALLVGTWDGGVSLLPAPPALAAWWRELVVAAWAPDAEALAGLEAGLREHPAPDDLPQTAAEWVDELLQAGALGWLPAPATA